MKKKSKKINYYDTFGYTRACYLFGIFNPSIKKRYKIKELDTEFVSLTTEKIFVTFDSLTENNLRFTLFLDYKLENVNNTKTKNKWIAEISRMTLSNPAGAVQDEVLTKCFNLHFNLEKLYVDIEIIPQDRTIIIKTI